MQADLQQLNSKVDNVQLDIRKIKSRLPRPKVPRLPSASPSVKRKSVKHDPSKSPAVPPIPLSPMLLSSQPSFPGSAPSLVELDSSTHSMVKKLASVAHTGQSIDRTTTLLQLRKAKYEAFKICPVPAAQLSSALVKYQKRAQRLRQRLR